MGFQNSFYAVLSLRRVWGYNSNTRPTENKSILRVVLVLLVGYLPEIPCKTAYLGLIRKDGITSIISDNM